MKRLGAGTAILATALVTTSAARAADQTLIDTARKEGVVTWYTTLIVNQTAQPVAAAFEKKYGIKVDYVRNETSDIMVRIFTEQKAGLLISTEN